MIYKIDVIVCFLWNLTFTLIFIGTKKYKYPVIRPVAQIFSASIETAVAINIAIKSASFNYAAIAYWYWAVIELLIIFEVVKMNYISKDKIKPFFITLAVLTAIMLGFLQMPKGMLYFALINTIIAMTIWLYYILDKDFPISWFTLVTFIVKFVADALGTVVYFGQHDLFVAVMTVVLPIIDIAFFVVWFYRRFNEEKYNAFYDKYKKYLPETIVYTPETIKPDYSKKSKKKKRKK